MFSTNNSTKSNHAIARAVLRPLAHHLPTRANNKASSITLHTFPLSSLKSLFPTQLRELLFTSYEIDPTVSVSI